jgi:2-oxoglutarate ferredoxin oxidoreductase subunit delta
MSRIVVDERYCKGCGLCIEVCPRDIIVLDPDKITDKGYHPAKLVDESLCTGCASCAVMCPDVAITVERS